MKLSEIFRLARTKYLWDGVSPEDESKQCMFSCDAIRLVLSYLDSHITADTLSHMYGVFDFVEDNGCKTMSFSEFDEFESGRDRQGARYAWLYMLELLALEEGI